MNDHKYSRGIAAFALGSVLALPLAASAGTPPAPEGPVTFWLTLLHNNDGESQLVDAGSGVLEDFGGVDRFAAVVKDLGKEGKKGKRDGATKGSILVSSGDNFLAGPEYNASVQADFKPFYDAFAVKKLKYDALAIGNHEFDFGPDVLQTFIENTAGNQKFLSANLDFSNEPGFTKLVSNGRIATRMVWDKKGQVVGIIGATTPDLPFISTPRDVVVDGDVAGVVQAEIDALKTAGVNKIILISHLQSVSEDEALIAQLRDLDIAVAGGGDELLANMDDVLIPGDVASRPYPILVSDLDDREVPVVTTSGNFKYVGRLIVGFNDAGEIVEIDDVSGPVRVAGGSYEDAVEPEKVLTKKIVTPVEASIAALAGNVIASSEVDLDGVRNNVRTRETNEGNLVADSLLVRATALASQFGAPTPDVALQNGGGIRNDAVITAGDFTELDTFDILPFTNFVSIVEAIPAAQFKEILENAVSLVQTGNGRFAQIAGFSMTWDANGTAQVLDGSGNVTTPGTRVREVMLDNGTIIVTNGIVEVAAPDIDVATIDFLARGGDQYPFRGAPFVNVGVSYQQALYDYVVEDLGGTISSTDYPEGGEGRITRLN